MSIANYQFIPLYTYEDLIFTRLSMENIYTVIDSIYEIYYDSLWFKKANTESEIKQSIFDKLNHRNVFQQSMICIEPKSNIVLAGYFCHDLVLYLQNNHKWNFHKHFSQIELGVEIVTENLKKKDKQQSLWSFWSFNIREDTQPEIIKIIITLLMTQFVIQGYKRVYSFDYNSLQGNSDDNLSKLTLMPIVNFIRKAYKHTQKLHIELYKEQEFYDFVDHSVKWIEPIFDSEEKTNINKQIQKNKSRVQILKKEGKYKYRYDKDKEDDVTDDSIQKEKKQLNESMGFMNFFMGKEESNQKDLNRLDSLQQKSVNSIKQKKPKL